jgi:ABC-type multidrug transport system ATPase subunit
MIAFRGVSKSYRSWGRETRAVEDVTLDVAAGEVMGIAGPNGAGKSTLIAMLLGFVPPTAGEITVHGDEPRVYVERYGVAYLPELMSFPKHWRADAALRRLAVLAGIASDRAEAEVIRVLELLELGEHARKRIKALSKGNAQRVGLAQALLRGHDVVVFDEPTHGLDPVWTLRFRDVVASLRAPGRAMVIASHNLDELERVCDRVAILDRGRLQRVVTVRGAASTEAGAREWVLRVAGDATAVATVFPGATIVGDAVHTPPLGIAELNAGLQAALAAGVRLTGVAPRESTLEAEFHKAVAGYGT